MTPRIVVLSMLLLSLPLRADEPWALFKSPVWKTPYRETLTDDEKVAGLARMWSEVKFNFANFDIAQQKTPRLDWDAEFLAYLPRVKAATTTADYYRVLQEMLAKLHDGHTYVWPPREVQARIYADPAIATKLVEGKVLVTRVDDPALGVSIGDEIVAIDGEPVREYAEARVGTSTRARPSIRTARASTRSRWRC